MRRRRDTLPLAYERAPESRPGVTRADIRNVALVAIMLALIGLAGWLYLYQTSEVASCARQIKDLEQVRERLHREIIVLRAEVARLGSLRRVLEVGEKLGYGLPEASDSSRHLRVVVRPPLQASWGTRSVLLENGGAPEGGSGREEGGLLRELAAALERWIESPLRADQGALGEPEQAGQEDTR